jgi:5'-deoxynucleotidase
MQKKRPLLPCIAKYPKPSYRSKGDINHVTKYHNVDLTREFKKIEEIAELECLKTVPIELQPTFKPLLVQREVDPEYKTLVKVADLISAYLKACDELRFQNSEFSHVKIRLEKMLSEYRNSMPEVDYFLSIFQEKCFVGVDQFAE